MVLMFRTSNAYLIQLGIFTEKLTCFTFVGIQKSIIIKIYLINKIIIKINK